MAETLRTCGKCRRAVPAGWGPPRKGWRDALFRCSLCAKWPVVRSDEPACEHFEPKGDER